MKKIGLTILVYFAFIAVVWLAGWLLVANWYSSKFDNPYLPILNFSALPALLTAIICTLIESLLLQLRLGGVVLLADFVFRIMSMILLSAFFYFYKFGTSEADKYFKVAYVLTAFVYYNALLIAHVVGTLLYYKIAADEQPQMLCK